MLQPAHRVAPGPSWSRVPAGRAVDESRSVAGRRRVRWSGAGRWAGARRWTEEPRTRRRGHGGRLQDAGRHSPPSSTLHANRRECPRPRLSMPDRRWRVTPRSFGLFVIDVDDGRGFRPATTSEVDAALRQRELFGAADYSGEGASPRPWAARGALLSPSRGFRLRVDGGDRHAETARP